MGFETEYYDPEFGMMDFPPTILRESLQEQRRTGRGAGAIPHSRNAAAGVSDVKQASYQAGQGSYHPGTPANFPKESPADQAQANERIIRALEMELADPNIPEEAKAPTRAYLAKVQAGRAGANYTNPQTQGAPAGATQLAATGTGHLGPVLGQGTRFDPELGLTDLPQGTVLTDALSAQAGAAGPAGPAGSPGAPGAGATGGRYDAIRARYNEQIDELLREQKRLRGDTDYTKLQEQARVRGPQSLNLMRAAIAAGIGGDESGAKDLNTASLALLGPQKIEGGTVDAAGNLILDPGYKRQKELENVTNQIATLEKQLQGTLTAEELAATRAAQTASLQGNRETAIQLQLERINANRREQGLPELTIGPNGQLVQLPTGPGAPGAPAAQPDHLPKSATSEDKKIYSAGARALEHGAYFLTQLAKPGAKDAFGMIPGAASIIQNKWGVPLSEWTRSPEEMQLQAQIFKRAYEVIHELAGAALTEGEANRLRNFVFNPTDSLAMIQAKINAEMQNARLNRQTLRKMYGMTGEERFGGDVPAAKKDPEEQYGNRRKQ